MEEAGRGRQYIDLSHTIRDGLVTYKGFPAPVIRDYLSREASRSHYAPGTEFQVSHIKMVASTGTYIDCPYHRYERGKDLSNMKVESFADLEAILVRALHRSSPAIGMDFFAGREVRDRAVLVHTGWDRHWETDRYFEGHPHLTAEVAEYLRDGGARLVGIDSMNIDDTHGGARPVHSILLGSDIPIVEHLCNLDALPEEGFTFSAIPPAFEGVGSFPVRAFAKLR